VPASVEAHAAAVRHALADGLSLRWLRARVAVVVVLGQFGGDLCRFKGRWCRVLATV